MDNLTKFTAAGVFISSRIPDIGRAGTEQDIRPHNLAEYPVHHYSATSLAPFSNWTIDASTQRVLPTAAASVCFSDMAAAQEKKTNTPVLTNRTSKADIG